MGVFPRQAVLRRESEPRHMNLQPALSIFHLQPAIIRLPPPKLLAEQGVEFEQLIAKPFKEDVLYDANDLTTPLRRCLFRSGAPSMAGR
jgi:hypothetical protein